MNLSWSSSDPTQIFFDKCFLEIPIGKKKNEKTNKATVERAARTMLIRQKLESNYNLQILQIVKWTFFQFFLGMQESASFISG